VTAKATGFPGLEAADQVGRPVPVQARSWSTAAARLEVYPSEHRITIGWS